MSDFDDSEQTEKSAWSDRLLGGFRRTSDKLSQNLTGLVTKSKLTEQQLDDIEDALIVSDLVENGRPNPRAPVRKPL